MPSLDPHIALLLAAGRFCAKPAPDTQAELARLAPGCRGVYEILPALYRQLTVAAERIANAPPAAWPLAAEGLGELLAAIGREQPAAAAEWPPPAARARPLICPHCGELSASPYVCDVCGLPLRQNGEAA